MPKAPAKKEKPPVTRKATRKPKELTPRERIEAVGIDALCEFVANGESLNAFAKLHGFAYVTLLDWINSDANRSENYAHAREARADLTFDQLDEVSEEATRAATAVEVQGLRLKSDNIKWKLARMNSKKYGEKLALGGADDLPPIKTMTDEQLDKKLAEFHASKG